MIALASGTFDDLEAVMRIMTEAFDERFGEGWTRAQCAGILPMAGVRLVLALDSSATPIGFSLYRSVLDDAELLLLAVSPEARGHGVGSKLLSEFVTKVKKAGASRIHLEVREGNPAIRIYEVAGFKQVGRRRNYYRGNKAEQFDALTFVLAENSAG